MLFFSLETITLWTYFSVFFFGIIICFTPCVYPVIPVIIGYLGATETKTKRQGFLKSISYVLGMATVYSGLGAIAALTGGIFGRFQTNFWVGLFVANIFIIMGLFMLEVFTMPQIGFLQQKKSAKKNSIIGAFFTGAISGLVVGPCTTPVLGSLLAFVATKQNLFYGVTLLFTYALGLGFPLVILGTFVSLLKKIPKSGYWMLRIKKIFGIILIACGEYFLLNLK
ncbi:MAG: cytochrome c biogenesis protein CcdA [Candidatus Omnitrophota bacterium]